jgi:hypothetical protein
MSRTYLTPTLFSVYLSGCVIGYEERGVKKLPMAKSKKNKNKAKLNLTVREEQRNKLEQMASSPIQVPEKPSTFPRHAQRNAFRRRDARLQSRSFARWNPRPDQV